MPSELGENKVELKTSKNQKLNNKKSSKFRRNQKQLEWKKRRFLTNFGGKSFGSNKGKQQGTIAKSNTEVMGLKIKLETRLKALER